MYDVVILGGGAAGFSAAIYAIRYNLKVLVVRKDMGVIADTAEVANYLGVYPVSGFELVQKFESHAKALGVEIKDSFVEGIAKVSGGFSVKTSNGVFEAKSVIYALGGNKRKMGLPEEKDYVGKGVSYCATCDGAFFKNKIVIVTGGANSAVEAAIHMANIAKKVIVVYRRDALRAQPVLVDELKKFKNVDYLFNSSIEKIEGATKVEKVVINGKDVLCDGVFVEYGYEPNSHFAETLGVELDEHHRIKVKSDMSTNIAGFFGAGDVTNGSNMFDQIIIAASEGAIAGDSVFRFCIKKR